jgi:hypothetical protein
MGVFGKFFSKVKEKVAAAGSSIANSGAGTKVAGATGAALGAGYATGAGFARATGRSIMALHGQGTWIFLVLACVAHIFHVMSLRASNSLSPANPTFGLYVILALFATFLFYKDPSDPNPFAQLPKFLLITVIAYYVPAILSWAGTNYPAFRDLAAAAMFLAPVWVIYIFLNPGDLITKVLATVFFVAWFLYVFSIVLMPQLSENVGAINQVFLTPDELRSALAEAYARLKGDYVDAGAKSFYDIKRFTKNGIANATQVYYTGTVDQSQGEPIGVFITEMKPMAIKFDVPMGEDVIVDATMRARTVGEPITITNACFLNYTDASSSILSAQRAAVAGEVYPPKITIERTGEAQEKYPLQCVIPNDGLKALPANRITTGYTTFSSTFNFETWGYAQYGFMDNDLKLAFRDNGQNPATEMGVPMTVQAKYTPGPVMIGMPSDSQPLSFTMATSTESDPNNYLPAFGATFSSAWAGKGTIKEFNHVKFYVPKPFSLNLAKCTPRSDQFQVLKEAQPWRENEVYSVYYINNPKSMKIGTGMDYPFITIRCPMEVDMNDRMHPVLGPSGAGKFTFFVQANYTYTLESRTPVTLQGPEVSTGSTGSSGGRIQKDCPAGTTNSCGGGSCWCYVNENDVTWTCTWPGTAESSTENYGERSCRRAQ